MKISLSSYKRSKVFTIKTKETDIAAQIKQNKKINDIAFETFKNIL